MRTGELARRAGVNIERLRFHERQRLLRSPSRTASGYCDNSEGDLEVVRFIKQCQHLGFTLKEIVQLADLHQVFTKAASGTKSNVSEAAKVLAMSKDRLRVIDEKILALQTMRSDLARLGRELRKTRGTICPAPRK